METGVLQIDRIRAGVRSKRIGREILLIESTTSAIDEIWRCIENQDADGMVIFTEHQSAGRGRMGRTWQSPRGASLLLSVALVDRDDELGDGVLGLLAAVSLCDAIVSCTDVVPAIKWPNDVTVSNRKLGGILIESRVRRDGLRSYAVGIGVNCLQQHGHLEPTLADRATSLEIESAHAVDREVLAGKLIGELDRWLADPAAWTKEDLRKSWMGHAEVMGRRVCLQQGRKIFSGSIIDLDPSAALIVQLDQGGVRAFDAANTTVMQVSTAANREIE